MRRVKSEAAVGRIARLVGDLLESARFRVEVDALRGAKPHAMRIGNGPAERLDDLPLEDGPLRRAVGCNQQLAGGVEEKIGIGNAGLVADQDPDQRSAGKIYCDDI